MFTPKPAALCLVAGVATLMVACASSPIRSPAAPVPAPGAQLVVDLEARFAAASREKGARAAFLEFLAEDSIVLQPGPVWGRAAWESADKLAGTLDWDPGC